MAAKRTAPASTTAEDVDLTDLVVLIVDDDANDIQELEALLTRHLPEVVAVTAHTAEEGLSWLRRGGVDLIISDYRLPGMDGLQLLEHAQDIAPATGRIMLTAFADLDLAMDAVNRAKVDGLFHKPYEQEQILETVRRLLAARVEALPHGR